MAGTSVKDVGSLLNFVGSQKTAVSGMKAGSADSFGDVMNKASYSGTGAAAAQSKIGNDKGKDLSGGRVNQPHPRKEALKAGSSQKAVKTDNVAEDMEQAAAEAGSGMVRETAKELGITEEEVVRAMEELGLGLASLLDADNLTKLVLSLSGEESPLALLTNEGLYGKVQNLLQSLEEVQAELMEAFSLSQEELEQMLAEMKAGALSEGRQPEASSQTPLQGTAADEMMQAKVTVTVEESSETVKFTVDENGNTVWTEKTAKREEQQQNPSGKQDKGSFGNEEKKRGFDTLNPMQDALLKNQAQGIDEVFDQMTSKAAPDTREIMNQILDYMKIQLKPGMDQLEMQLHPANLGSLHIQLTSKGGEVTAQFHVQNEAVKAAIESQLTILKDNLKELGVKVEAVEVTVESHAFESNLWQGQQRDESSSYQGSKRAPRRINLNEIDEGIGEETDEEEILAAEMMRANGGTVDYTV